MIVLEHDSRFAGDSQYAFRHGLLREAAYAMLTDADRAAGHRIAGEWLEGAGEKDPLTLADHFELGGEMKRAVPWLIRAARAALNGANFETTITLAIRGLDCGAENFERGVLELLRAAALFERGELLACVDRGREAMRFLPVASPLWFSCAGYVFLVGAVSGDREKCLASGCNGYLAKPFTHRELDAAIRKLVT